MSQQDGLLGTSTISWFDSKKTNPPFEVEIFFGDDLGRIFYGKRTYLTKGNEVRNRESYVDFKTGKSRNKKSLVKWALFPQK